MRTAIVGLGRMGMRHVEVAVQLGLDVVAVCDHSIAIAQDVAQRLSLNSDAGYADVAIMLGLAKPELLIVSTTAPSHRDIVVQAAESGVQAILCEKPMATSLAACDEMITSCRKSGTKLAINHQMRFMEQYTRTKDLVSSEALGGLGSVLVSAGNFGAAMNGTHYFEMFRFLTDEEPVAVTAWFSPDAVPNPRGPQYRDAAGSMFVRTASGKRLFLDCSSDQGHGVSVTYNCRFGRIVVDELSGDMTIVSRNPEFRDRPTTAYGLPAAKTELRIEPADAIQPSKRVLEALLTGEGYPTGEDGRLAMRTLFAAHLSHELGGSGVSTQDADAQSRRELPIA